MRRLPAAVAAIALAALGGCASGPEANKSRLVELLDLTRSALADDDSERIDLPPGAIPQIDPALLAGVTDPVLLAYFEGFGALATLGLVEQKDGVGTWFSANNSSLSLAGGGLVVATRGLGADLIAADVSQVQAGIESGRAGEVRRVHRRLDGLYGLQRLELRCALRPVGRESIQILGVARSTLRIEEHCTGPDTGFVNTYWRDAQKSLIWQSQQWINPDIGVITLQRLVE